jgi:hypothetical protein
MRERATLRASDPRSAALDARLAAVIIGAQTPADALDRTRLAYRAYEKALHASSARQYGEAFANDPKLTDGRRAQHLYDAGRAAALADLGHGADDPKPDETAKAKLRAQALGWLKAELSAWREVATTHGPGDKRLVAKTLDHWNEDIDLVGVRDDAGLAEIAEPERNDWKDLWAEVDALRARVALK